MEIIVCAVFAFVAICVVCYTNIKHQIIESSVSEYRETANDIKYKYRNALIVIGAMKEYTKNWTDKTMKDFIEHLEETMKKELY